VNTEDSVAVVTLSDPATMNAAGVDLVMELADAFGKLAADKGVRAVILTGEGRGFCSGANLQPSTGVGQGGGARDAGSGLKQHYNPFMTLLRDFPKPLVTAINGAAAGVGCSLALVGDIIVAAESAYFLQAFRRIGLVPDGGSTYLLPRMIGRARAMEMTMLGERVPAAKAEQWGMINRCVPDAELMTTARTFAKALADGPESLVLTRKLMWNSLDTAWAEQLDAEADTQSVAGRSPDFAEGVRAFLEKRPAEFGKA
jgi:2-(1,2-epoxy-1,2-dihydrophenyl)acetyl-CoA isomerase